MQAGAHEGMEREGRSAKLPCILLFPLFLHVSAYFNDVTIYSHVKPRLAIKNGRHALFQRGSKTCPETSLASQTLAPYDIWTDGERVWSNA